MTHRFGIRVISMALVAGVGLAGCESMPDKQTSGTAAGSFIGGILGSKLGGRNGGSIFVGALLGGLLGNVIGKQMDENDRRKMMQALDQNALGQSTKWKNETTGASYAVTPTKTFVREGRECRTFEQEAVVDGQPRKIPGTACKRAEGESWELTS
ncbi:MAG: RT0821/Lpp0805 family surface protein [Rubrivivax sp.]